MRIYKTLLLLAFFSAPACAATISCEIALGPFVRGERATRNHPHYEKLARLAQKIGVHIEWVDNVRARVDEIDENELALEFSNDLPFRFRKKLDFRPDAWFEDNTNPNLIVLDRKQASLATLIHELRHAVQMGPEIARGGSGFDQAVRQAKIEIRIFQNDVLGAAELSVREKKLLFDNGNRLYETASELAAYFGDYRIAAVLGHKSEMRNAIINRQEYRRKFLYAVRRLQDHPFSSRYTFIDRFAADVDAYYVRTAKIISQSRTIR